MGLVAVSRGPHIRISQSDNCPMPTEFADWQKGLRGSGAQGLRVVCLKASGVLTSITGVLKRHIPDQLRGEASIDTLCHAPNIRTERKR